MEEFNVVQEFNQQGLILFSQDKYEEAREYFQKAIDADQFFPASYINMAQTYIMEDKFEEAKENLNKAILVDKKFAPAYFHLGNIELLQNNTDAARDYYNKAISLGFNDSQICINLAADAEEKGDLETALSYYNRAISMDKFSPFPKARKVQLLITLDRLPEALKACDSLLETNPDIFEGYHYKFAILAELGKMKEAEDILNKGIELFPDDEEFYYDKARLYQAQGHFDEALKLLDERVGINEESTSKLIAFKAELLLALERTDEAEVLLDAEYQRSHDGEIAFLLNSVSIAKKKFDKALECSQFIIGNSDVDNYYYAAIYYKAVCLRKLGRDGEADEAFASAAKLYRAACSRTPGQLQLYFYRAMCYEELKQYDDALEMTKYVLNVDNTIAEAHLVRSKVFEALGNTEAAEEERTIIKELNPELLDMMEG